MQRDYNHNSLSSSYITEGYRTNPLVYSQTNLPPYMPLSRDKSVDRNSRGKRVISYQDLGKSIRLSTQNGIESISVKETDRGSFKENGVEKQLESVTRRVRELEGKMLESEHRVQALERSNKNSSKLTTSIEEFMRNQYDQIQEREELQERVATFQKALGHISTVKADKKDLEGLQLGRLYGLSQRCSELQRERQATKAEISQLNEDIGEINNKFQRMVGKIETTFLGMGQKYEQFIEGHIIKTIDHVNKITQECHIQIQQLSREQVRICKNVEQLARDAGVRQENIERQRLEKEERDRQEVKGMKSSTSLGCELLGVSLPGIRLVQSLVIESNLNGTVNKVEKKVARPGLNSFKSKIKEQVKDSVPLTQSLSTFHSESLMNTMYDSLQPLPNRSSNQNDNNSVTQSNQLLFDKVIYKLDKEFNLLDDQDRYILAKDNSNIKLSAAHIEMLREHKLIV